MSLRVPAEFGEVVPAVVTTPAAGANFSYILPAGYHYKLDALRFKIITDANVANRSIMLMFYRTGAPVLYYSSTLLVAEGFTRYFSMWAGLNTIDRSSFSQNVCSLPAQIYLSPPEKIESDIKNIQVGDQLSEIVLTFRRWPP